MATISKKPVWRGKGNLMGTITPSDAAKRSTAVRRVIEPGQVIPKDMLPPDREDLFREKGYIVDEVVEVPDEKRGRNSNAKADFSESAKAGGDNK